MTPQELSNEELVDTYSFLTQAEHYDPHVTLPKVSYWWGLGFKASDFKTEILNRLLLVDKLKREKYDYV